MTETLSNLSDDELRKELARRQKIRDRDPPEIKFCHACKHCAVWTGRGEVPGLWNPCSKGHQPKFIAPSSYGDAVAGNYGFYLKACADREPLSESQE